MAMPKNQQATLLRPFTPPAPPGPYTTTIPTPLTTREQHDALKEYALQRVVIETQAAKTIVAERALAQMTRYAAEVGVHTIEGIEDIQATNSSPMVQAFCERVKQGYAYQAADIAYTGGALINEEVARRIHPEPRRRRGWFD